MPQAEPVLVFGAGPTLHHVFSLAPHASEIHLGDYLRSNLDEISRWLKNEPRAHDWQPFVDFTLRCEGKTDPSGPDVLAREPLTRARITTLLDVDMRNERPLGGAQRCYGTVLSAYCVDSATDCLDDWQRCMQRILELVRPGGTLLVAALGRTRSYLVGGRVFPSPNLEGADMENLLRDYFPRSEITVKTVAVPECTSHGYSSIILVAAHCRRSSS